jgi:hypothetical protein
MSIDELKRISMEKFL